MAKRGAREHLLTAEVAKAVGVHPNTVRLYERWGFIPPVPRGPTGYRLYSQHHVDSMRLARLALHHPYPGGKQPVLDMIAAAVAGDLATARTCARTYLAQVQRERAYAEQAAALLESWAASPAVDGGGALSISQAAAAVGVTVDSLRNWERNGLLKVARSANGYRAYSATDLSRLRVIRLLRAAGYSMMAILRVLRYLDAGQRGDVRSVLGMPPPDDDVLYISDRWLATLAEQEERARQVIALLDEMER